MSDSNNGWKQPEEKFPETELQDSFADYFSEEGDDVPGKKSKKGKNKKGPDILAVSKEEDEGFVIKEVVALDTGAEVVELKEPEESTEEIQLEHAEENAEEDEEKADAQAENEQEEEEEIVVDLSAEETSAPSKKKFVLFPKARKIINKKRKHKYVATIGAVLIGLALIGAISVFSGIINLGARVLDNTSQKEAFEWKIYPLLMFDPTTFEDPASLDEVFVLKTSLWSALLENRTKYSYDQNGMLLVPASDLDVAAKSLYGNAVALNHQTFAEGYDYFYLYDEETNTYSVPVSGQSASYVPKVVDIKKNGDIYTLIVGYVAPTTLWNVSEDGSTESVPDKYLYYDLEKLSHNSYIIKAVRNIPADELPEDLEVSDIQSLNQTQYIDYDKFQQEQMNEQIENEAVEPQGAEPQEGETASSEETSSNEE